MTIRTLIVDDEPDILEFLSYNVRKEGYKVFTATNGIEALRLVQQINPSLILLDVMMPKMDGIETCQVIRKDLNMVQPVIAFLTARTEDYAQIAGFEAGADDYISKPIRPRLLISKIESLLRRLKNKGGAEGAANITIDRDRYVVELEGKELQLPKKEFELLELLASRPGKVFNRDQILAVVWGNDTIVGERTIDVHIRKIREKIGDSYIQTIKGVGYKFDEEVFVAKNTTNDEDIVVNPVFSHKDIIEYQHLVRRIPIADNVVEYAVKLATRTRPNQENAPEIVKNYIDWGAGPRASQNLVLAAKGYAAIHGKYSPDIADVQNAALGILRHRMIKNYKAEAEGLSIEEIIQSLF